MQEQGTRQREQALRLSLVLLRRRERVVRMGGWTGIGRIGLQALV